ncbi:MULTISPECIES: response regulator transcription factor [Donghicola]|jgi:CheY-like chemotaxis protein|uniref:Response regulatory domain-containing protein n=1 Tax=Donghicola eburneus TaxID=393278 RepID=A0A1M4N4P3_9RHOB|nr:MULTISPECIES: response regulator transcription factor [Donghicola]MCI5039897.1 response regulator transcription factor [Donghicola eburneus]MCT4577017.1 response regulator transcription factor [Donghicola sp.]SCM69813.1 hypothetical protein KARMA_4056 [Donghicola eburneus]SFQ64825.1 Response regulator receiver domain-containing protein [Donghicola eburneus]
MQIAILEDDSLHAQLMMRWLSRCGQHSVEVFEKPNEFLNFCHASRSAGCVIILDAYIDGALSGELIRSVRALNSKTACAGIILTSSLPEIHGQAFVAAHDVDVFVDKDMLSESALEIAATLAARAGALRQLAATPIS